MLWLAAAAAFVASPPQGPARLIAPLVQARATVRIVAGTRVHFGEARDRDLPAPRDRSIRTANGPQPARLIEFE